MCLPFRKVDGLKQILVVFAKVKRKHKQRKKKDTVAISRMFDF